MRPNGIGVTPVRFQRRGREGKGGEFRKKSSFSVFTVYFMAKKEIKNIFRFEKKAFF